jgi:hypothetical protein
VDARELERTGTISWAARKDQEVSGANTAIFSVIEGILLKPLPDPRPDELVAVDHAAPGVNLPKAGAAPFLCLT